MNFFLDQDQALSEDQIEIVGDQVHHFKNVGRGKIGDSVKVFDGKGQVYWGVVSSLKKKNLVIEINKKEIAKRNRELNLILGVPKKEYLDSILKSSVQLGLQKIFLVHTKFSPQKYKPSPRQEKLIISAVTQSENPFIPEIIILKDWNEVFMIEGKKLAFSTEVESSSYGENKTHFKNFIIGPEGGFHLDEIAKMKEDQETTLIKCPTAIMKAEVAVSYAAGMIDARCAVPQNQ